jgi:hypothetical protein
MRLLVSGFLMYFSLTCFAQENETRGTIKVGKPSANCKLVDGSDSVYAQADKMPEFPGGEQGMFKWISKNVRMFHGTTDGPVEPQVFCSFTVSSTGKIDDIQVRKGTSDYYEKEIERLLNSMPLWEPARCKDVNVPVRLNYPFKFARK